MTPQTVKEILATLTAGGPGRSGLTLPELLCRDAVAALPVTGASLALADGELSLMTIAASDECARDLADLQLTVGEGPGIDAHRVDTAMHLTDSRAVDERWPAFGQGAAALGARAVFALPLRVGAIRFGTLNLYRSAPGGLGDGELTLALHYADAARIVVMELQELAPDPDELHPQLTALQGGTAVHQATGMVSVQLNSTLAEALARLRARAYAEERSVVELAGDVIARRVRFEEDR
jgi:hypothetical protein